MINMQIIMIRSNLGLVTARHISRHQIRRLKCLANHTSSAKNGGRIFSGESNQSSEYLEKRENFHSSLLLLRSRATNQTLSSRRYSSKPTSTISDNADFESCYRKLGDLSFNNTAEAFKSKSNWHLWRAWIVLKFCSYKIIVDQNVHFMNLGRKVLGKKLFEKLMKATVYGHFVAGEDQDDIKPTIQRLKAFGVKSILDYSVEADVESESHHDEAISGVPDRGDGVISARTYYYEGEPECDRNMEIFRNCLSAVADTTDGSGLGVLKITALGRPQLLLHLSDVIAKTQNFYKLLTGSSWADVTHTKLSEEKFLAKLDEFGIKVDRAELSEWFSACDKDKDGVLDLYEWSRLLDHKLKLSKLFKVVNLKTGKIETLIPDLTEREESEFRNLIDRLNSLALFADEKNVRLMIDAEQTYLQPAIGRLTLELMRRYNKKKAVVFNTYQAYLKGALTNVKIDLQISRRDDFYFGAKLVRGAYMVQERRRAEAMGYSDPINPNFEATTAMYNTVLDEILQEAKSREPQKVSVMCATHNEETIRHALEKMREYKIGPKARIVCFGQLYGMCDQVSFTLGQAGFSVYKYIPYGPVEGVMPYLSRRVQENSGLLKKAKRERTLIAQEIRRRYKRFKFFHNPMSFVPPAPAASK